MTLSTTNLKYSNLTEYKLGLHKIILNKILSVLLSEFRCDSKAQP